jgi:RNA polymerase sigma-70 factor (ECF subfamily)
VAGPLLDLAKVKFAPKIRHAFCRVTLDAERPDIVAAELGMTTNSVFVAKSRVLRKLRQIAAGLIDSSLGICGRSL